MVAIAARGDGCSNTTIAPGTAVVAPTSSGSTTSTTSTGPKLRRPDGLRRGRYTLTATTTRPPTSTSQTLELLHVRGARK